MTEIGKGETNMLNMVPIIFSEVTRENLVGSFSCLSNSLWHSANADVSADVKSKIIVSHPHSFADMIFLAASKVQNYQNKTGKKFLYPNKWVLTT